MYNIIPHPAIEYDMAEQPGVLVNPDGHLVNCIRTQTKNIISAGNHGLPITYTVDNNVPLINSAFNDVIKQRMQESLNENFYVASITNDLIYHIPITFDPCYETPDNDDLSKLYLINDRICNLYQSCPTTTELRLGTFLDHGEKLIDEPSTACKKTASKLGISTVALAQRLNRTSDLILTLSTELVSNTRNARWMQERVPDHLHPNQPLMKNLYDSGIGMTNGMTMVRITDPFRLNYQQIKPGKAMRLLFPEKNDEWIKSTAAELQAKMQPPEFLITFDRDTMRHVYRNGPSSCMSYDNEEYPVVQILDDPDARPTDALANGDIGVAYLERSDGKVTARTLIVESKKAWVRTYTADFASSVNNGDILEQKLADEGYSSDRNALIGQHLLKIEADASGADSEDVNRVMRHADHPPNAKIFLAPYIDYNNPALIEHDNSLEVSNTFPEESDYYHIRRHVARHDPSIERAGVVYYGHGGLVTFDIEADNDHVDISSDDVITGTDRGITPDLIDRAQRMYPGSGDLPVYISPRAGVTTFGVSREEAAYILRQPEEDIEVAEAESGMVLADRSDISEGPDGNDFITDDAESLGYIWDDKRDEWINSCDAVRLYNGDITHEDNTVFVEDEGEYYEEDDPDVIMLSNGDYCLRDKAYRLPNGEFIHENEIERA